ncbi:SubName: Full=Related to export control protein CHS7 {ECO:0000313/EMBL:CCA71545.1} [Serendipita indica DSM 11827]|nr:SubName: Full=Related to export control protein CHS7 {ECO:0000313/EMBL:CCA71545.1} [Serendipita indica DSM 11827]
MLLQTVTAGSIFEQGSLPLLILTCLHAGAVAAFFWCLLANAFVATQYVEDGTPSSLIPFYGFAGIFFATTAYISADTAFSYTNLFKSTPPRDLRNIALFILLVIWPAVSVLLYAGIMSYIVVNILGEKRPLMYYLGALVVFIGAQLAYLFLGTAICQGTNRFIDSAFIATLLETTAMGLLFIGWRTITESKWEDQVFFLQENGGVTLPDPVTAPVGINVDCGIPKAGDGRLGNIVSRRRAAVGRVELRSLLSAYLLTLALQIVTNGSVLQQGSTPLVVLTAIHAALVAALFWFLLFNGIVATQVVEDGTMASLIPFFGLGFLIFVGTLYISLDTGFSFTSAFQSDPPSDLKNIALFVLTSVWPGATIIFYYILMAYVITVVLREKKPLGKSNSPRYLTIAIVIMAASQVIYMLANSPLCKVSNQKVDGSFIATLLETVAVVFLVVTWSSVTEESWGDESYY